MSDGPDGGDDSDAADAGAGGTAGVAERLRAGEPVAANWISVVDPAVGEITADLGFDVAFVDVEHTTASLEDVAHVVRAVESTGDAAAFVRAPSNDPTYLKRVLDLGVAGVMVPMVESAAAAEEFVAATRYPPAGRRGTGAGRAQAHGARIGEYVASADERLVRIAQVETPAAVEAAGEIAAVEGIDSLFLGPLDLTTAMGAFGDTEGEEFLAAVESVLGAADAEGVPVGVLSTDAEDVARYEELGFDWQVVGVDVLALRRGAAAGLSAYEDAHDGEE